MSVFTAKKKLGFGLMRLPKIDDQIDVEQMKKMVDKFLAEGFTYFDTAYAYQGSEEAARKALVERYPRDQYTIADKLPLFAANNDPAMLQTLLDTSLARLRTDYVDYYMIHSIRETETADRLGAWDFMKRAKASGKARHIGFSFHGTSKLLDEILTNHPEMEFVQLQINYIDWDSASVESGNCYRVATKHNVPIIVMEPVKGGSLVNLTDVCAAPLKKLNGGSLASYAIRFAASLENVAIVLSGMSDTAQMDDNTSYMKEFKPLSDAERAAVNGVVEEYKKLALVPCTGCGYCKPGCPAGIAIPNLIEVLNMNELFSDKAYVQGRYRNAAKGAKAGDCLKCGACEDICPQHLSIREILADCAKKFEA